MDAYRLFIYSDDGQLVGPAQIIHAANDAEAIAQAEVVRGSLAAELLDVEGLRIVKYLPGNGGAPPTVGSAAVPRLRQLGAIRRPSSRVRPQP